MPDIASNPLYGLVMWIISFINDLLVPLVFALAFIAFIWGVFNYFILGGADEEKREQGKTFIMWGIIALFVMVSVWGLVNLLVGTFSLNGQTRPDLPNFEQQSATQADDNGSLFGVCPEGENCIPGTNVPWGNENIGL